MIVPFVKNHQLFKEVVGCSFLQKFLDHQPRRVHQIVPHHPIRMQRGFIRFALLAPRVFQAIFSVHKPNPVFHHIVYQIISKIKYTLRLDDLLYFLVCELLFSAHYNVIFHSFANVPVPCAIIS